MADDTAALRLLPSASNPDEIAEWAVASEATDADAAAERALIWLARTLVSPPSEVLCARMDALAEATALVVDTDAEDTAPLRTSVSALNAADVLTFAEVSDDTAPLMEVDKEATDVLRAPVSLANAMENFAWVS